MTAATSASPRSWEVVAGRRLHVALVSAASAVALTSSGDSFVLAALLGLVAADIAVAGVAALVAISMTVSYGASSLAAAAGAQGVLGPAAIVGEPLTALAAWAGAAALALVGPRGLPVVAFGLSAAAVLAGPALRSPVELGIRLLGAVGALCVTWAAARYIPRRGARWAAAVLALAAIGFAAAGRFAG